MNPLATKILAIAIAVVVVAVGIAWFVLSPKATPTTNPNTTDPNSTFNGRSTVGVSSQPGQGTQGQTLQDYDKAYDTLYRALLGQRVAFIRVDQASQGAEGEIYKLYASDFALNKEIFPKLNETAIDVAMVDLNQDGAPEALVYETMMSFCGTGGCTFDIYQKRNGIWVKVFTTLAGAEIATANVIVGGYLALYIPTRESPDEGTNIVRHDWDGNTYQPGQVMAHTTGSGFTIVK